MSRFRISSCFVSAVLAVSVAKAEEPRGSFSGRVADALSGNPIEGAMVWIDEKGSRTPMDRDSVFTDAAGAYSFSDLAPIEERGFGYLLGVKMAGYRPAMPTLPINLGPGEAKTLDFALQPPLSLHVRVVDADDSGGLAGAGLVATLPGDRAPFIDQMSDSSGWFHLQDAPRTTLELTLTKVGYRTRLVRKRVDGFRREAWPGS